VEIRANGCANWQMRLAKKTGGVLHGCFGALDGIAVEMQFPQKRCPCWKMRASETMAPLKFLLQDPLQAAATAATTTLPQCPAN